MRLRMIVAIAAMLMTSFAAQADDIFTFTPDSTRYATESWTLPSSPMPNSSGQSSFLINNVLIHSGNSSFLRDVQFFTSANGGGLAVGAYNLIGAQLFSGGTSTPTFIPSSYFLQTFGGGPQGTLTITASTPEPASLALLSTGILGVIGVARRQFAA